MKKTDTQEILEAISRVEHRLGQRIDGVENSLGQRIDGLDRKIDGVEDSLGQRIDGVEQKLSARIDGLDHKIDGVENSLRQRIDGVEESLSGQIDLLAREVHKTHGRFDDLHEAVDVFSSEIDRKLVVIGSQMVTKDYLDRKLADQFTGVVDFVRKRVPNWVEKGARL